MGVDRTAGEIRIRQPCMGETVRTQSVDLERRFAWATWPWTRCRLGRGLFWFRAFTPRRNAAAACVAATPPDLFPGRAADAAKIGYTATHMSEEHLQGAPFGSRPLRPSVMMMWPASWWEYEARRAPR